MGDNADFLNTPPLHSFAFELLVIMKRSIVMIIGGFSLSDAFTVAKLNDLGTSEHKSEPFAAIFEQFPCVHEQPLYVLCTAMKDNYRRRRT